LATKATRDLFVAKVSHEFRTPLQSIVTNVDMIELLVDSKGKQIHTPLRRLKAAVEQVMQQAQDLRDYVRSEEPDRNYRPEPCDLRFVIDDVMSNEEAAAVAKGLRLRLECPEGHIMVDKARLRQVVANLVSNAVK